MDQPVDQRITAAQLVALKDRPDALEKIAELLQVERMPANLKAKSLAEIEQFVFTGNATQASQLIHAALVRQRRKLRAQPSNN